MTTGRDAGTDPFAGQVAAFDTDVDQGHIKAGGSGTRQDLDLLADRIGD